MGAIHHGIPRSKALELKDRFNLRFFVETGTYMGKTATWASLHFETVYTIEVCKEYLETAKRIGTPNIHYFLARSENCLGEILHNIHGLSLVWLDAHWSRDLIYPAGKDICVCPVMDEISWVERDSRDHVIMVDDYRLFGEMEGWVDKETLRKAVSYNNRYVFDLEDVLISVPTK